MIRKLWSASAYYYGTSEIVKNTIKMSMQFSNAIDFDILRGALDQTQKRYPYFSIRAMSTPAEILLEDNPLPWVLKEQEEPIELNSEESNFHMIAFRYKEDWLYIDVFHGMSDASGLMNLLRTLTYYYCREAYDKTLQPGDCWLVEDPILPEEVDDPYQKLPPQTKRGESQKSSASAKEKPAYMNLEEENNYDSTKPHVFRLEIPQKELMKYCGENDGSPATAIALFLARAIKKVHKDSSKTIGCGMATNLRKALGTERSHQSTVALRVLDFTNQIANLPFDLQGTTFRGQVLLKCDADALKDELYASHAFYGFINSLPTLEEKIQTMRKIIEMKYKSSTVSLSYVGKSHLGECEKFIKQLFTEVTGSGIVVELNALNDIFCLTFIQEWEEKTYFERFCKELDECGISYVLKSEGPLILPTVRGISCL